MGDLGDRADYETVFNKDTSAFEAEDPEPKPEIWQHGSGQNTWQVQTKAIRERTSHLYNNNEMSDLTILACDENWWFGQTVKDYVGHRFLLGSASPVFHRLLYEFEDIESNQIGERKLALDPSLQVTLTLTPSYSGHRLELDGIPPIAAEALLQYIYSDTFKSCDFENGYSRNLLWRLWHASKAFEMEHLNQLCTKTIDDTMCDETIFWDLNYSIQYKSLGVGDTMTKVLKLMEAMNDKLYEHPNFVWLDQLAIKEILEKRKPNNCEPVTILNNLLRWTLYQIDRTAVCEVDEKSNGDIAIEHRLEWISQLRRGDFDHLSQGDLKKYLSRGTQKMPWTEMSQSDFLTYVVPNELMTNEQLLESSIVIMKSVVENPERLTKSAHCCEQAVKNPEINNFQNSEHQISSPNFNARRSLLTRGKKDVISISKIGTKIINNGNISEDEILFVTKPTSPA